MPAASETGRLENRLLHLLVYQGILKEGDQSNSEIIRRVFEKLVYLGDFKLVNIITAFFMVLSLSSVLESVPMAR